MKYLSLFDMSQEGEGGGRGRGKDSLFIPAGASEHTAHSQ